MPATSSSMAPFVSPGSTTPCTRPVSSRKSRKMSFPWSRRTSTQPEMETASPTLPARSAILVRSISAGQFSRKPAPRKRGRLSLWKGLPHFPGELDADVPVDADVLEIEERGVELEVCGEGAAGRGCVELDRLRLAPEGEVARNRVDVGT